MSKEPPKKKPYLNEYHQKRNEAALKAVAEMAKHPYTLQEKLDQAARLRGEKPKSSQGNCNNDALGMEPPAPGN